MLIVICSLIEKNIEKIKTDNKNVNFPTQECQKNVESEEISFEGNVCDFQLILTLLINLILTSNFKI